MMNLGLLPTIQTASGSARSIENADVRATETMRIVFDTRFILGDDPQTTCYQEGTVLLFFEF